MKFIIYLVLCLYLPISLLAQELRFEKYRLEDGLAIVGHDFKMYQDSLGFLWIPSSNGLNRFEGREFRVFKYNREQPFDITGNDITDIVPGPNNELWIGIGGGGINIYHPETERYEHLSYDPSDPHSLCTNGVREIIKDQAGNMWIKGQHPGKRAVGVVCRCNENGRKFKWYEGTLPNGVLVQEDGSFLTAGPEGIFRYLHEQDTFLLYKPFPDRRHDKYRAVAEFYEDGQHKILLMARREALRIFNLTTEAFENLPPEIDFVPLSTNGIFKDRKNNIWFGGSRRVLRYKPETGQVNEYKYDPSDPTSLITGRVASIFQDRSGSMWFSSTFMGGLSVVHAVDNPFEVVQPDDYTDTILVNAPFAILDSESGVKVFDLDENQVIAKGLPIPRNTVYSSHITVIDRERVLWRDTKQHTIFSGDLKTGKVEDIVHLYSHFALGADEKVWLENMRYYDLEKDTIVAFGNHLKTIHPELKNVRFIYPCFSIDKEGRIWQGTDHEGILRYDPATQAVKMFSPDPANPNTIPPGKINQLFFGEQGWLYINSTMGCSVYKPELELFEHLDESEGFPNAGKVPPIIQDHNGHIWVGMLSGLIWLDPKTADFQLLTEQDGLPSGVFNNWTAKSTQGHLFFTRGSDLIRFHPDSILWRAHVEPVILTDFYLNLKKVAPNNEHALLDKNIAFKESIVLDHTQSDFGFRFVSPNFYKPEKTQYYYKLENYSEDWVDNGNKPEVHFTNIPAGNYTFRVKAKTASGYCTERPTTIKIRVLPPWWQTGWAYAFYILVIMSLLYWVYQYQLRRRLIEAETARLTELNEFKTRLYTNITHEFRTPLTVIQGMAAQIEKNPQSARKLIKRNSEHLLRLVTQLLDMSKLESKKMQLELVRGDIIAYLRYLAQSFESYAIAKGIQIQFTSQLEKLEMDFDPKKIQHIIYNLLSNAIKFTPDNGKVELEVSKVSSPKSSAPSDILQIIVRDNGIGMSEEELPHIFDRFYQVDNSSIRQGEGTGIGLALTKELLKLMNGSIVVKSELAKGSEFMVQLPIAVHSHTTAPAAVDILVQRPENNGRETNSSHSTSPAPAGDLPLLLLVEDNPDVALYIKSCLEGQYQILFARDGEEGIRKALEVIPDMIISDVMMPGKNGYELTNILKNDERSSHIPIILLTAKADIDSRLEGLERGADAYLTKPFDKKELLVRVQKLIELRQKMQARYARLLPPDTDTEGKVAAEDLFLQKVRGIISAQLDNPQFGVAMLCQEVGISQPQLYRKIKALTNKSTAAYITTVRLHIAKELLQSSSLTVAEVAYKVGYNDPSYFTKSFSREFGCLPSEIVRSE